MNDPADMLLEPVGRDLAPAMAAATARKRGSMTQAGIDMLFEQIPSYLEFFGYPAATPDELRRLATIVY